MVYQIELSNDGDWVPSGCGSSVMDKIKMRVNFLLSDSNMKIDFLRGKPRCRHIQHAQNPKALDNSELEKEIHVKVITDKLVKVKSEVDYTVDALRQGATSLRAHNAKLRLLQELEYYDSDLHRKLQQDLQSGLARDSYYVLGGEERNVDDRIRSENHRNHVGTKASLDESTTTTTTLITGKENDPKLEQNAESPEEPQRKKTWAFFNQF